MHKLRLYILMFFIIVATIPTMQATENLGGVIKNITANSTTPTSINVDEYTIEGDCFKIDFKITDKWEKNYNAELKITNKQNTPLESWKIKFDLEADISDVWGAEIEKSNEQGYTASCLEWNRDIAVGESVSFGFQVVYKDVLQTPCNYQWINMSQSINNQPYLIEFTVDNNWGEGFTGEICITNNSLSDIVDWQLEFDYEKEISQFWNATIIEHTGEHYLIKNNRYNATIKPGETLSLGFLGVDGSIINIQPINYILTSIDEELESSTVDIKKCEVNDVAIFATGLMENTVQLVGETSEITGNIISNGRIDADVNEISIEGNCESRDEINFSKTPLRIGSTNKFTEIRVVSDLIEYSPFGTNSEKEVVWEDEIVKSDSIDITQDFICFGNIQYNATQINLNQSILATGDITITASDIKNTLSENIFICSQNGNITIDSSIINLNAIIYAPSGTININGEEVKLAGKLIGEKIYIDADKFNFKNKDIFTDIKDVENDLSEVSIRYYGNDNSLHVTQDLFLVDQGTHGTNVTWKSDKPEIIDNNGCVTRPNESTEVELTAIVSKGNIIREKTFNVYVIQTKVYNNLSDYTIEDLATLNGGVEPYILADNSTGVPRFIDGKYTELIIESPEDAIESLYNVKSIMNIEDPRREFTWINTEEIDGNKFFRLQQTSNGVETYGRQVVVSVNEKGESFALSGNYTPDVRFAEVQINPKITKEEAYNIVVEQYGENILVNNEALAIYALYDTSPRLAWILSIDGIGATDSYINEDVIIDAITGEIIINFSNVHDLDMRLINEHESYSSGAKGDVQVRSLRNKPMKIRVYLKVNTASYIDADCLAKGKIYKTTYTYLLHDNKANIYVYDCNNIENNYPGNTIQYSVESAKVPSFNQAEIIEGGIDALGNVEKTYEFYKNVLERDGIDDNNGAIKVFINYVDKNLGTYNACWNGIGLAFTQKIEGRYPMCTALDIVAHEYTHAVIDQKGLPKLVYRGLSGAIEEAYADIMGELVEGKLSDSGVHGEDSYIEDEKGNRSLSNPGQYDFPSKVGDKYYKDYKGSSDRGYVHTNLGVIEHAAWLMYENNVPTQKIALVWYDALCQLPKEATFEDCRAAVTSMARKYNYEKQAQDAFDKVGIFEDPFKGNEWYYDEFMEAYYRGQIGSTNDLKEKAIKPITVEEFVNRFNRLVGLKTGIYTPLEYAKIRKWIDSDIDSNGTITRQEAVSYIWSVCSNNKMGAISLEEKNKESEKELWNKWENKTALKDQEDIQDIYEEGVKQIYLHGILNGDISANKKFEPSKELDYAYYTVLIYRLQKIGGYKCI